LIDATLFYSAETPVVGSLVLSSTSVVDSVPSTDVAALGQCGHALQALGQVSPDADAEAGQAPSHDAAAEQHPDSQVLAEAPDITPLPQQPEED
jgi:hypothetical protein